MITEFVSHERSVDNLNKIQKKMRSQTGASITFALLLFLVCAILSSVILVAGTTAAGRLSNMSNSEQNYFAVMSVAKTIKATMEKDSSTLVTIDEGTDDEKGVYLLNGSNLAKLDSNPSMDKLSDFVAYKVCRKESENTTLGISGTEALNNVVNDVSVTVTVSDADELVTFQVSRGDYHVQLDFTTQTSESEIQIEGETPSEENKKIVYSWELSNIQVY